MIASGGTVSISPTGNGTILQAIAYKSGMINSPVHMDVYYSQGGQQLIGGGMAMAMPASRSETFVYDQLGNRKGVNVLDGRGNVTFARRDNGLNQYASWTPPMAAINYDTNGVLTSEGWITGTYNALNQPITISSASATVSFGYDPLGRCVKRTSGTATYLYYDGWNLIQEGANYSSASRIYVHGNRVDEIVADQAGGVWSYHHYDARGHCILLTDASGNLVEQYSYDAFGKIYYYDGAGNALSDSARGNRFLFTGREYLKDLKLYDYRNRMYQPELGRFMQPDPKQFEAGDYNLYRYCHNDPVNKSDPTGLMVSMGVADRSATLEKETTTWETHTDSLIPQAVTRVVLGGNALKPVSDPSHYTSEKLKTQDGRPAAGLTTTALIPNDNGTVTLRVDWCVRDYLAAKDPRLVPTEMQHVERWIKWIDRMNGSNSDLSRQLPGAAWNKGGAEAVKAFLDPGRYSKASYYRNELITQQLQLDGKGKPHAVLAETYGLTD